MTALRRIRKHVRASDFLKSAVEFLLSLAFAAIAVGLLNRIPLVIELTPDLEWWMACEIGAAFILGVVHFVSYDDPRLPRWVRVVFAACFVLYIVNILRHMWMIIVPLLFAKAISLWLHGTLTEEQFGFRLLKGLYLFAFLVVGAFTYAVLDAMGGWPDRSEPPWILASIIALYYAGLGVWQVVLECFKRMPDAPPRAPVQD